MEALIGISFKALTYEPPKAPDPERLSVAAAEAQARLIEDTEEWEIADEEGGDGGSAVKLLPAAEMAQNRAFHQGLRRAVKAEEAFNRNYTTTNARSKVTGDHRGGKDTNGYDEEYPSLKPSIERKGEIKYHAADEKKMRKKAAQESDDDDDWGWIGEHDGKVAAQNDGPAEHNQSSTNTNANTTTTTTTTQRNKDLNYIPPHKRPVQNRLLKEPTNKKKGAKDDHTEEEDLIALEDEPKEIPLPPQHLMARLKQLDFSTGDDDAADGGVALG